MKEMLRVVAWAAAALAAAGAAWGAEPAVAALPADQGLSTVRTILDPATGRQWALARDPRHPGGPGRLELLTVPQVEASLSPAGIRCIVRSGDRITVEEHTGKINATLDAVALNRAENGERVRARLRMGGAIVAARAGCNGHADLIGGSNP